MNVSFKQDTRKGSLATALGQDALVLLRFAGNDHMNDLFSYEIEALSTDPNVDFDQLIGTHATVRIESQNHGPQSFDGIVTEARWVGEDENGFRYDLIVKPWLWLAGRRRNQRIFHNKSVVEILETLLQPYSGLGNPAFKTMLSADYPELEYTVQYRESDLDFATRLMERFGINYHFEHTVGSHSMILTDAIENHGKVPGGAREFKPADGTKPTAAEHFWQWHAGRRLTTGAIRLTDYNFKTPTAAMEVDQTGRAAHEQGQIESYDYPGDYLVQNDGKGVVGLRVKQERGQDIRHNAIGDCTSLKSGLTLDLTGDTLPGAQQTSYVCLSASHRYASNGYGTGTGSENDNPYSGTYTLMPTSVPLAPERKTAVPIVQGPQTAVVVGEGEIDCDKYGRILVHFHWDLDKAYSMRCRVSQNWASKGWGGMIIPRIGMEVIVEFLEGDPDKPVVTGCVYNGKNDPPYPLPANKTRSVFKTDTHQGTGFNELRIEDEAKKEEIYIHAQKDRNEKTLNNHSERIDNNWVQSVGHNKSIEVTNNHVEQIGGNMAISIGPAGIGQVVNNMVSRLAGGIGSIANTLGLPGALNPGEGNMSLIVEKGRSEVVGTVSSTAVGISSTLTVGKSIEMTSGKTIGVTAGERASESVGKSKTIDVGDELIVTVGQSRLIMKKDGTIQLIGKDITLQASGDVVVDAEKKIGIKATSSVTVKGSELNLN